MNQFKSEQSTQVYSEPCIYQIKIQGRITSTLLSIIDDMQVREDGQKEEVSLVGWLPDQSALMGLLMAIHEIHYGILSAHVVLNDS